MIKSISNIGNYYLSIRKYEKALSYYQSALKISEDVENKEEIFWQNLKISNNYKQSGDYIRALSINSQMMKSINKEKSSILKNVWCLESISEIYFEIGEYNKCLEHLNQALSISKKNNLKHRMMHCMVDLALCHYHLNEYNISEGNINKILENDDEGDFSYVNILQSLIYKKSGKQFDKQFAFSMIKERLNDFDYGNFYLIYQLLEDTSYLKTAYNQVQEKASAMEGKLAKKFLSYPIPKAIGEEWEKVK